jgi:hypothetical protein
VPAQEQFELLVNGANQRHVAANQRHIGRYKKRIDYAVSKDVTARVERYWAVTAGADR